MRFSKANRKKHQIAGLKKEIDALFVHIPDTVIQTARRPGSTLRVNTAVRFIIRAYKKITSKYDKAVFIEIYGSNKFLDVVAAHFQEQLSEVTKQPAVLDDIGDSSEGNYSAIFDRISENRKGHTYIQRGVIKST